jgi:ubiquitin C-terminal hydrolase
VLRKIIVKFSNSHLEEFNNEDHHDAHEFLIWLLDNIHENMKLENKRQRRDINVLIGHLN